MYSSIVFSALTSASLFPLLSLSLFLFAEKTSFIFALVSYFSTSLICELLHENISLLEMMDVIRLLWSNMLAKGRAHVILSMALTTHHPVFLYSPMTLTSNDEIRILETSVFVVMGDISLISIIQRRTKKTVSRPTKICVFELFSCFVLCHLLPLVRHYSNLPAIEYFPVKLMKFHTILGTFCNFGAHLVLFYDLIFFSGKPRKSVLKARSIQSDGVQQSPNTPVECSMMDLTPEVLQSAGLRADRVSPVTDHLIQERPRSGIEVNSITRVTGEFNIIDLIPEVLRPAELRADRIQPVTDHLIEGLLRSGIDVNYIGRVTDDELELRDEGIAAIDQPVDTTTAVNNESVDRLSKLDDFCLERIAKQVTHYKDFLAFSEVNHSSRNVCSSMEWDEGPKPPCLMLSEDPLCSSRFFLSLYNSRAFVLELEAAVGRRIWGSPHGWLVTLGPQLEGQLMNPISQVSVNLPPFPTIHNKISRGNKFHRIQKILVFKIRIDKFLVMVIFCPENLLAFTIVGGDGEWVWITNPEKFHFRDISYLKGKDQVFALCDNGSLVRIEFAVQNIPGKMSTFNGLVKLMEFSGPLTAKVKLIANHPIGEFVGYLPQLERQGRAYLVVSPDDHELFGVFRYSEETGSDQKTVEFAVHKFNHKFLGWEDVFNIRDKAFFVGNNNSWSIVSATTVNCKNNSIYYTDDNWELEWLQNGQGLDIGIYDMETRRTEGLGFALSTTAPSHLSSTWITPGLTPNTFR